MPDKNYADIAAKKIRKPSSIQRRPRILVYGRQKKGKSTFGATAPKVLVVDPEQGTDWMTGMDPDTWAVNRWEDLNEVYNYLRLGDHPYEWVCLDGLTRLNDMALDFTMRVREERQLDVQPGMVAQKDWGQAGKVMKTMMVNFHNLTGMGIIFTAQERPLEQDGSEADADVPETPMGFVADLPKGSRGMINSLVDVIGRIYVVDVEIKGVMKKQRRLWLGEHPLYDTGGRSEHNLPDYLKNPTVPKLVELLATGKVPVARKASQ